MIGKLDYLPETPSQTAGPYVHIGLIPHQAGFDIFERPFGNVLAERNTPGERIRIEGRVLDGLGAPCRDVLLEIWQANAAGRYNHPADQQRDKPLDANFRGWGRTGTEFATGLYQFETIKPGPGDWAARLQADGAAREYLAGGARHQYRPGDPDVFRRRGCAERAGPGAAHDRTRRSAGRLCLPGAKRASDGVVYVFDIRLQGEQETVFFDV